MMASYMLAPALPKKWFPSGINSKITKIMEIVCAHYTIGRRELFMKRRFRHIVVPRQICHLMLYKYGDLSVCEIANMFNSHHTTILHSWTTIENQCFSDPDIKKQVREIENKILS